MKKNRMSEKMEEKTSSKMKPSSSSKMKNPSEKKERSLSKMKNSSSPMMSGSSQMSSGHKKSYYERKEERLGSLASGSMLNEDATPTSDRSTQERSVGTRHAHRKPRS